MLSWILLFWALSLGILFLCSRGLSSWVCTGSLTEVEENLPSLWIWHGIFQRISVWERAYHHNPYKERGKGLHVRGLKFIKPWLCALAWHVANFIFLIPLNNAGRYKYSIHATTTATTKTQETALGPDSYSCWVVELGFEPMSPWADFTTLCNRALSRALFGVCETVTKSDKTYTLYSRDLQCRRQTDLKGQ